MMRRYSTQIKTTQQIKDLKKAAVIAAQVFREIKKHIKPMKTELDIKSLIDENIRSKGLRPSFETIAACGSNCANPHAVASKRMIKKDDFVMLDFGVVYKGMHSDMTRMVRFGKPNKRLTDLYAAVKHAQKWSIMNIRAGIRISDHVKGVHDLFRNKGYGKYIRHTLGHGVGSRIHEAPKLSERNQLNIKEKMVVTIEPGLYIKGLGGIRIEDMVLITRKGCEVLTQ